MLLTVFAATAMAVTAQPTAAAAPVVPAPAPVRAPAPDWDLTPIFADAAAFERERAAIDAALPTLTQWRGKLADPTELRAALAAHSALRTRAQRVFIWANLQVTRDGADPAANAAMGAASALWAKLDTTAAFLEPELVALDDAKLAALATDVRLAPYRRALEDLRTRAAHVLPTDREALMAAAQPLVRGSATIRDVLFNVELPRPTITIDGQPRPLGTMALRRLLTDPDRAARRSGWEAYAANQDAFKGTSAAMLNAYLAGVAWEAKTRGWASQVEMVTAGDPMPAPAFAALRSEVARAAQGPLARYVALKAKAFGLPALASYDLAAPLRPDTRRFTIDEAKALTLAAVAPLGREYQDRLARGMAGKWIDWHPLPAKAPGGLTLYGVPDLPAYIAITYNGDASGLAIYAHEWGHWLHWDYARGSGNPPELMAPQTSSNDMVTFVHEMLVADRQIAAARTRDDRIVALTSAIEALRTSYYGVVPEVAYELAARTAADQGTLLTPEVLSGFYCDARKQYTPPGVELDPRSCLGWVTQPYAYYDLYFYRYLLATSAAAWFAERLEAGDRTIADRLKAFLSAGGSADTPTLLKRAGFDVADPSSYAAMTRRVERLTTALEREIAAAPTSAAFDDKGAKPLCLGAAMRDQQDRQPGVVAQTVEKRAQGTATLENVPPIPAAVSAAVQRYQNSRAASLADWTNDGKLLILTRFGNTAQVHRIDAPLAARTQLTFYSEPIGGAAAIPDSDRFLFTRDTGGDEWFQYYTQAPDGTTAQLTEPGTRNFAAVHSRDGKRIWWAQAKKGSSEYVIQSADPADPTSRRTVFTGTGMGAITPTDVSADGTKLLFTRDPTNVEQELFVLDLVSGRATQLFKGPKAIIDEPRFTRDGRSVLAITNRGSDVRRLVEIDLASGTATPVSPAGKWDVEGYELSGDGRTLAWTTNEDGFSRLTVQDFVTRRALPQPDLPTGVIGGLKFNRDGTQLGFSLASATAPGDVWSWGVTDGKLTRWTRSEAGPIDAATLPDPKLIRFRSFDGLSVPAFVYRPKAVAAGAKTPVLISIHGGPEAQARPGWSPAIAYYTDVLGATVIVPNVRGSDGYGKRYLDMDNAARREDSVKDIGALLDWVAKQPDLDAKRVAVIGGSYGGYMVLASMTHYSDRLAGGVESFGIGDWVTFLENTEAYRRDNRRAEYGDERDPKMRKVFDRISPRNNVAKITKPMLIAQGANDPRVPRSESEQMVAALRQQGVPVSYLLFADEGHGWRKKQNADLAREVETVFLQRLFASPDPSAP